MYYKNQLKKFKELKLNLWEIATAAEVEVIFWENQLNPLEFEIVCEFVYNWIMSTKATVNEVCVNLKELLDKKEITIDDLTDNYNEVVDKMNSMF